MPRTKKDTVWNFKIGEITFFIFEARPVDIPKIHAIEIFTEEDVLQKYLPKFASLTD